MKKIALLFGLLFYVSFVFAEHQKNNRVKTKSAIIKQNFDQKRNVSAFNKKNIRDEHCSVSFLVQGCWKEVAAGTFHTLAIASDGSLWSWGWNNKGELGLGDNINRNTPTQLGVGNDWTSVSAGDEFSLAIKNDGTLWSWGLNNSGQLGLGDNTDRNSPVQVGVGTNWQKVSAGHYFSLAITFDNALFSWGRNDYSQLGLGDTLDRNSPEQIGLSNDWQSIAGGQYYALAIKTNGALWSWGYNFDGRLGIGNNTSMSIPTQVGLEVDWQSISAGFTHGLAIKENGTLWSWGGNWKGQLGLGDNTNRNSPMQVGLLPDWKSSSASTNSSVATKTDGTLWSWGWNNYGQLGLGDTVDRNSPEQIGLSNDWQSIFKATYYHFLATKTDDSLWVWGYNGISQLGLGDTIDRNTPEKVDCPSISYVDFQFDNLCFGSITQFNANISQTYDSISWEFGDGSTSFIENPTHTFPAAGNYDVTLLVTTGGSTVSETKNVTIFEQPTALQSQNITICDNDGDGMYAFDTSNIESTLLNGQTNVTVTYTDALGNVLSTPLPNPFITATQTITVEGNISTSLDPNGICSESTTINFVVAVVAIANPIVDMIVCDDNNDGFYNFDTSAIENTILGDQTGMTVSYTDASGNTLPSPLPNPFNSNTQSITAHVENVLSSFCFDDTIINFVVNEQPILLMDELWSICEGDSVTVFADSGYDEYVWSTGDITSSIVVDLPGTYQVTVTNIYGSLRCETSKIIYVVVSNIATITNIETVDWSQYNNTIAVFVEGEGDYEYSIDGTEYQDESVFDNLDVGNYSVLVRDKNGCGVSIKQVYLLNYPNFFTPNGDGINDTWQIINAFNEPLNKLLVFDRFGKFMYEIKPDGLGWDGTYNGSQMTSSDYWFILYRENGKQYRGHFSLKR